jgi:hypothetical protein
VRERGKVKDQRLCVLETPGGALAHCEEIDDQF